MRKCLVVLGVAVVAVLLTTSAFAQNRGVSFTGIGFIENPGPFPASNILAMNPQGTVFVASPDFRSGYAVLWTREGGWGTQIGNVSGVRISADGTVMAGGIYPGSNPAYLWPGTWLGTTNEFNPIPPDPPYVPCGSSRMSFYDMGGNGDYAVGLTWAGCAAARGFLWDKATNTSINLGSPNTRSTRANAVTADGQKVIGWGTALWGGRRGASWQNGTWTAFGDPNFLEPKACITTPKGCTSNSADPVFGCPEYVDDGSCPNSSKGTCTAGVCVGGFDAGKSCTSSSQCGGTCAGGPNNGLRCTSNFNCPDTPVCLANPNWTDDLWKGEAFDASADGRYAVGRNFDYGTKWDSGYRMNPDGSFSEIPVLPDFPYIVNPLTISDNGKVAAGFAGGQLFGFAPFFWTEATGTVDLQLFLVAQGLDELFFWYLYQVNAVSADGMILAGQGANPDGLLEGFIVDLHKVWICHAPPGNPENARTLGVAFSSVGDHLAHGDFLGTCEFKNSSGLSRATELREQLKQRHGANVDDRPYSFDPSTITFDWAKASTCSAATTTTTTTTTGTITPVIEPDALPRVDVRDGHQRKFSRER